MEILLWLVPSLLVTAAAMVWVSWLGREGRGEVDRDVAVERLGRALSKERPAPRRATPPRVRDRSTGIAVRPTSRGHGAGDGAGGGTGSTRRVS